MQLYIKVIWSKVITGIPCLIQPDNHGTVFFVFRSTLFGRCFNVFWTFCTCILYVYSVCQIDVEITLCVYWFDWVMIYIYLFLTFRPWAPRFPASPALPLVPLNPRSPTNPRRPSDPSLPGAPFSPVSWAVKPGVDPVASAPLGPCRPTSPLTPFLP